MSGALVLSGGGLAGIAWELGVLIGIRDAAPGVYDAITAPEVTYLGTSAGSSVASQLAGGTPIDDLFAMQLERETAELGADMDLEAFQQTMASVLRGVTSDEDRRRRIGAFARQAQTVRPADRRAVIESRLLVKHWPDRRLLITAVNTGTGELTVFNRDSGVELVDAVSASCAVPGIWPTVEINGVHYTDGGVRSLANADVVVGSDPVLILVPTAPVSPVGETITAAELAALGAATVTTVFADTASITAFGQNPLDPAVRPPAAEAGRVQGRELAASLQSIWA